MSAGRPIMADETMRGWWATALRMLSLVLALALVVPGAAHAAEGHRHTAPGVTMMATDASTTDHADACPACHANCSCHQAINLDGTPSTPARETQRHSYRMLVAAIASVPSDRLPRPPRA